MTLAKLKERLDTLSPTGIRFVARMVESLSAPPQARVNEQKTWLPGDWIEYFGLALSVHHGTTTQPLEQKGFETVFRNACESVGWVVENPVSETQRFLDLNVQRGGLSGLKLSLKSTAAQRISRTSVHISKLTEAAWIQDMRTAKQRRERTLALFREYMNVVGSIMMLRAFRKEQGSHPSISLSKYRAECSTLCRMLLWRRSRLTDRPSTVPMQGMTSRLACPWIDPMRRSRSNRLSLPLAPCTWSGKSYRGKPAEGGIRWRRYRGGGKASGRRH